MLKQELQRGQQNNMEFPEFYAKLVNILEIYKFILESRVCPETSNQEWLKVITYLYLKDWLWVVTENNKIQAVIGAYRINEFDEAKANDIPEKDEGEILFIPFACSVANDIFIWRNLLRSYSNAHKVRELIFCDYQKDGYKKYRKYKIKGASNESIEIKTTGNADILPEPITVG